MSVELGRYFGLDTISGDIWRRLDLPFRVVARLAGRVEAAARRLPWGPVCLEQALAACMMLRWRGVPSRLCIGVATGDGRGFRAHAWLVAAGGAVCGGPAAAGMTPIVVFRGRGC